MALVFPNNDPVAFMVAFYGCLLAEVVPVPIEVPLSRKVPSETHPLLFHTEQRIQRSLSLIVRQSCDTPATSQHLRLWLVGTVDIMKHL